MRILLTTGLGSSIISFGNMGDVSMLQAGTARLWKLWPDAVVNVLTEWPEKLLQFCPGAVPLSTIGRDLWIGENLLLGRFAKFVPGRFRNCVLDLKRSAALRYPSAFRWCLNTGLVMRQRPAAKKAVSEFSEALAATDAVVTCGAGGFFDSCREWNMMTLDVAEAAVQRRIPVALFGQHFGPLSDGEVLSRARRILPSVDIITLRGHSKAQSLLESLGVHPSRIRITGDEAIELAHSLRPAGLGGGLGINFRLRTSAETGDADISMVRPVLQKFAREHRAPMIPAPIAVDSSTSDYSAIRLLLQGYDDDSDGGAGLGSPQDVIRQIGRCRVLVTCAYHAAVFALAQGIPVVALTKSSYFNEKFIGLKERFGQGCEIVSLERQDAPDALRDKLEGCWEGAHDMHLLLLESATRQIESGWTAYNQLKRLVDNRVDASAS